MKSVLFALAFIAAPSAFAFDLQLNLSDTHGGPQSAQITITNVPNLPEGCIFETDGSGIHTITGDPNHAIVVTGNFIGTCAQLLTPAGSLQHAAAESK